MAADGGGGEEVGAIGVDRDYEDSLEYVLAVCPPNGAAAYVELCLRSALLSWQTAPRDARGALGHLGRAISVITLREDL